MFSAPRRSLIEAVASRPLRRIARRQFHQARTGQSRRLCAWGIPPHRIRWRLEIPARRGINKSGPDATVLRRDRGIVNHRPVSAKPDSLSSLHHCRVNIRGMKSPPGLRTYFLLLLFASLVPVLGALATIYAVEASGLGLFHAALGLAAAFGLGAGSSFWLTHRFERALRELIEAAKTAGRSPPSDAPRCAGPGAGRARPRFGRRLAPIRAGARAVPRRRGRAEAEQIHPGRRAARRFDRQLGMGHRRRRHRLVGGHVPAVPADARERRGLARAPDLADPFARPRPCRRLAGLVDARGYSPADRVPGPARRRRKPHRALRKPPGA